MLEQLNSLVKFAQTRNIFVCDFIAAVKVCQAELYSTYNDNRTCFMSDAFRDFNSMLDQTHDSIHLIWKEDLNTGEEQLVFDLNGVLLWARHRDEIDGTYVFVSKALWEQIISDVKNAAATNGFYGNLLPSVPNAKSSFDRHLEIIKAFYCGNSRITAVGRALENRTGPILDASLLNFQANMFKTTMMGNCHAAMVRPVEVNPLTAIWRTINSNAMLSHNISEYLKETEIACVQVLGSVKDERTFSTLSFIKNRLRNRLEQQYRTL